jgi:hypothetical protein
VPDLVIGCRPALHGRATSEYSIHERGSTKPVAGPFPDAASASIYGRALAQQRGVELWFEDRDDRGRAFPPRRLWPRSSGVYKMPTASERL